jgi:hypothetical protein
MNEDGSKMTISDGTLVENAGRPEWGPGKVVHVDGSNLHIVFRDLEEDMARVFRADAAALKLAEQQSDPILDNLPRADAYQIPSSLSR